MNSKEESQIQEVLDDAIKLLYSSRPARAAALLGLVNADNPISLAPSTTEEKVSMSLSGQGIPFAGPNSTFTSPSGFSNSVQRGSFVNQEPIRAGIEKVKKDLTGDRPIGDSPGQISGISESGQLGSIAKGASLAKHSMTEQEYLMYQTGMLPDSSLDKASLTPTQLAALGGGTVGVVGANRLRAKNVAGRELNKIRRDYLEAVRSNTLTKQQLKNLNRELKLRGAGSSLTLAPTVGIADAQMAKAEKNLTSKVLKNRYRGALPLLAAGLIGTAAYNKLNEV